MKIAYDSEQGLLTLDDGVRTTKYAPEILLDILNSPAGTVLVSCGKDAHGVMSWKQYDHETIRAIAKAGQEVK